MKNDEDDLGARFKKGPWLKKTWEWMNLVWFICG
jgi:hypothetical protein